MEGEEGREREIDPVSTTYAIYEPTGGHADEATTTTVTALAAATATILDGSAAVDSNDPTTLQTQALASLFKNKE